jgi:predicted neutral ceramidase superfamily lipid hydrolase
LSASIGSVDYLFDIDIYYKRYQYIGVISFCIVGVSIVLTNLATTKQVDDYPKILRFFGLYIFLPLAIVYAVILMSYGAKILITQTWPK